jgi:MFS transporter, AAHS family, 4-hydroxybenzoate transporter
VARVEVDGVVGEAEVGRLAAIVTALCLLVAAWDGYDVLAIAFAAPVLVSEWALSPEALGVAFGAAPIGMALGAALIAPLGDRIGRRATLVLSCVLLRLASCASALAPDLRTLVATRVVAGLGIGGALPTLAALTAEFAPANRRNLLLSFATNGYTLGTVGCGLIAAPLIARWGWQALFWVGGIGPLGLAVVLLLLPESPMYLATRKSARARAALVRVLRSIAPGRRFEVSDEYVLADRAAAPGLRALFAGAGRRSTPLVWAGFFGSFFAVYFLFQWIPAIVARAGHSPREAIYAGLVTSIGAGLGPIVLALASARWPLRRLIGAFFVTGFVATCALGQVPDSIGAIYVVAGAAGFLVLGAEMGLYMYAAGMYPSAVRSTGLGWALAVGRLGAIAGPICGGLLIGAGLTMGTYLPLLASSLLISALAIFATSAEPAR